MKMATLYHYCSTSTFHAIVATKSIRLSSLSLSNDTMEGKLVADTITRLAKKDQLDVQSLTKLQQSVAFFESIFDGLGFCLSEASDLLSQWRGYAADATGVSIGFSCEYFEWLGRQPHPGFASPFSVKKVHYDAAQHEIEIDPTYCEIKKLIAEGAFRPPGIIASAIRTANENESSRAKRKELSFDVDKKLLSLLPVLFLLKSSAFREEQEWRLLTHLIRGGNDDCEYHPLANRLVPFRKVNLIELERLPIVEIVLAPKHLTPYRDIADCLMRFGFGKAPIRCSEASYR